MRGQIGRVMQRILCLHCGLWEMLLPVECLKGWIGYLVVILLWFPYSQRLPFHACLKRGRMLT
eukprot:7630332-Ditylum_brightwellii.AAC.1